tara:strand:- start:648 stop:1361 length:714 start_codon:yes stop_codon:yes gene_type:complete
MKVDRNTKIILGIIYLLVLTVFLYFLFSKFSYEDLTSIKFIQSNQEKLTIFKENNIFLISLGFVIFSIFWVCMLGFGSPIALTAGFIFGKWLGTLLTIFGLATGALCLYLIGNFFLYNLLREKFEKKFAYLESFFSNKQFVSMVIFRFVGIVPFFIQNLLPVIFNIKSKNYYFGTIIGILPSIYIINSLGEGLASALYKFENLPSVFGLLFLPEIYIPLIAFLIILIISFFLRKKIK